MTDSLVLMRRIKTPLKNMCIYNVHNVYVCLQFRCCGVDGPNDWTEKNAAALPHSCCRDDGGQGTTCSKTQAWQDGCLQKSIDMVKEKSGLLFKIIVGIAGGEVSVGGGGRRNGRFENVSTVSNEL